MVDRNLLVALSIKYEGNYRLITQAIIAKEDILPVYSENCVVYGDINYPKMLYHLEQAPYVLFYKGDITLLDRRSMGVIGSRNACRYALNETKNLIASLDQYWVVVSGLARGIDGFAHQCALNSCSTLAVLGHGLDWVYPKENAVLFQSIERLGLLISEYPSSTPIRKHQFVERNRIIAALSSVLCVMQAQIKSGTMSTVDVALSLGIEIFALPYHLDEMEGEGCNLLIQQGASLLTSSQDLFKL